MAKSFKSWAAQNDDELRREEEDQEEEQNRPKSFKAWRQQSTTPDTPAAVPTATPSTPAFSTSAQRTGFKAWRQQNGTPFPETPELQYSTTDRYRPGGVYRPEVAEIQPVQTEAAGSIGRYRPSGVYQAEKAEPVVSSQPWDALYSSGAITRGQELAAKETLTSEEKQEARALQREIDKVTKTREALKSDKYAELTDLSARLYSKSNWFAGFGAGVIQALGFDWLTDRTADIVEAVTGIKSDTGAQELTASAQKNFPVWNAAGNIAGKVIELVAISSAVGRALSKAKWFTNLALWVQRATSSAITFGISGAAEGVTNIQSKEEWDEQERAQQAIAAEMDVDYTPRPYNFGQQIAKAGIGAATGAAAGALGGALSSAFGAGTTNILRRYGLQYNTALRAIASGITGVGFAAGSAAAQEVSKYLQYPEGYTPNATEIGTNLAIAFLFSTASSVINDIKTSPANKEQILKFRDLLLKQYGSAKIDMANMVGDERVQAAMKAYGYSLTLRDKVLNSPGMSGVQKEVKSLLAALDMIDDQMLAIISGGNGLLGAADIAAESGAPAGVPLSEAIAIIGANVPAPKGAPVETAPAPQSAETPSVPAWYTALMNTPRPMDQPARQAPALTLPQPVQAPQEAQSASGAPTLPPQNIAPTEGVQAGAPTDEAAPAPSAPVRSEELTPEPERGIVEGPKYTTPEGNKLAEGLRAYDRLEANGFEYTLSDTSAGWIGHLRNTSGDRLGGMISDARALDYQTQPMDTREEAVDALVQVAERNNLLTQAQDTAPTAPASEAPVLPKEGETDADIAARMGVSKPLWNYTRHSSTPVYGIDVSTGKSYMGDKKAIVEVDNTAESVAMQSRRYGGVGATSHDMTNILKYANRTINSSASNPLEEQPRVLKDENGEEYYIIDVWGGHLGSVGKDQARLIDGFKIIASGQEPNGGGYLVSVNEDGSIHGVTRYTATSMSYADYKKLPKGKLNGITKAKKEKPAAEESQPNAPTLPTAEETRAPKTEDKAPVITAEKPTTEKPAEKKPHEVLAESLIRYLDEGNTITPQDLQRLAEKAFGGSRGSGAYDIKTAYDALELAVNKYLMAADFVKEGNGGVAAAERTEKGLEQFMRLLPTQSVRTEEQQQYQQFSTPPNIAYLAAWAANISDADTVLEPSAGIGGLALWPKAWGATVYGNELSPRRAEILRSLGLDEVFTENAEQINNILPDYVKPTVVLMNPPFSSTAGRTSTNKTANAKRHVEQALARLDNGGRLVAILGQGMANDSKTFAPWWNELRKKYDIRANLSINGENYRKYGTTFDVQLVVIDKTGPQTGETITGSYDDLTEIPQALEGIRSDRTQPEKRVDAAGERGVLASTGPERNGPVSTRPSGNPERPSGTASGNVRGEAPVLPGNGGRVQPGGAGKNGLRLGGGENGSRVGGESSQNAGGVHPESQPERNAGPESELSVRGLEGEEKPLKPQPVKKTAASQQKAGNDDNVYAEYIPPKTPVKGAKKHPAKIVESAAMAAVDAPQVSYTPNIPKELIASGALSDVQLTNIVYAGQAHSQMIPMQNKRKGYFIGDGTGVGKGRQLAGIILDNFRQGRNKAVWISQRQNLYADARRDWKAIGMNPDDVISSQKVKASASIGAKSGIYFTTYDTLANKSKTGQSRIDQLVDWLGKDFDGVICFDEAHTMGNVLGKQSKMGKTKPAERALAGAKLQDMLPNARIVYASATMATNVDEMAFAERLGLWGPGTQFNNVRDFVEKISAGGMAAMELVARDMKAMGLYQARSISYDGVEYETLQHDLTPMQKDIYDTMSRAWQTTLQNMNEAMSITGANLNGRARAAAKSAYYGALQRFYNQVLTSMAVPSVIKDMKKELAKGRSVVLQIVNTNEAETERQLAKQKETGESLEDLDITPREALLSFFRNSFPVQAYETYTDENGNELSRPVVDSNGNPVEDKEAVAMRDRMIREIEQMRVPEGPLEMIFDAFGTENVAEVTGRSRRVVPGRDEYGNTIKVEEKRGAKSGEADATAFQDGQKRILIFSDAGGTGKSYHADRTAKNQQQRVHYLLQPGWSAPKAVQGFGRTHRSNEASAPIYKLVTTDVKGQKRFVSTIARRLDQLGALTKGQRQTGSGMFSARDNLESELATDSLYNFYRALIDGKIEGLDAQEVLEKLGLYDKFYDSQSQKIKVPDGAGRDMSLFLNRILALEYDEQNLVFDAFSRIFDDAYETALANGTLDMGMETVRADKINILDDLIVRTDENTGATTNYVQAKLSEKARILKTVDDLRNMRGDFIGLYRKQNGDVVGVFRTRDKTESDGSVSKQYILQTPLERKISRYVEKTLKSECTRIPEKEWDNAWAAEVEKAPEYIDTVKHMLTGSLLPVWNRLPKSGNVKVQRLIADDGRQYLGRIIDAKQIDDVLKSLGVSSGRTKQSYTVDDVIQRVYKNGDKATLEENRMALTRRRVGNEWRIEITGDNLYWLARNNPDIIQERINYKDRFFIPNGEKQRAVLDAILAQNPVRDIESVRGGDDEVSNMVDSARKLYTTEHDFTKPMPADEFAKLIEEENNPENYFPKGLSKAFLKAVARKATFTRPKLYRGIDSREFDFLAENKFLKSNSSYNFSDQQGQTLSDESARYALSYATGYAPKEIADLHYKDGLPTYLIEFINAPNLNVKKNNVQESYTYDVIDQDYITRIFEITYDPETGKDMVQDVTNSKTIKSMFPNLGKAVSGMAHGVPALYRDKTTGTILYAVQGPDGYETGDYISEKDPSMMFNYDRLKEPAFSKHAPAMLGISGNESDLELWTPEEAPQNFNGNTAPRHPENWKAERVGDKDKTPMSLTDIVNMIRHDFDIPVTTGNIRSPNARAQYRRQPQSIRTKVAKSIPDIAHELGHHLDNIYDIRHKISKEAKKEIVDAMPESFKSQYKDNQLPGEGVAEFLRRYLQNSETAAIDYPVFTEEFFGMLDSKGRAAIEKLADEMNAYYSLSEETGNWPIHNREDKGKDYRDFGEKLSDMHSRFRTLFIDSMEPLRQLDKAAGTNVHMFAINSAYAGNRAYAAITGDLYDLRGNYLGPGLQKALKGIRVNNKKEYTDFGWYLTCRHGPERLAEGMRVTGQDAWNNTPFMDEMVKEFEERYPEFRAAADRFYEFIANVNQIAVDAGLYSQDTMDSWMDRWHYYVPLNRWFGNTDGKSKGIKRGYANQTGPYKHAYGSGEEIINPVDNVIENTVRIITVSIYNDVMQKLTQAVNKTEGLGWLMEKVPMPLARKTWDGADLKSKTLEAFQEAFELGGKPLEKAQEDFIQRILDEAIDDVLVQYGRGRAHGNIVTVMKGGKPEYWMINDPALLKSIANMETGRGSDLINILGRVNRFITGNITGMNVVWALASNSPRDLGTLITLSKSKNVVSLLKGILGGYVNSVKGEKADALFKEYIAMGGGSTSAQTADKNMARAARKALQKNAADWLNPLETVEFISDMIERGPRYAEYRICRTKYGMSPEEAFYAAMEVTTNFKRRGLMTGDINKIVPFFNASVQGVDRMARWLAAEDIPQDKRKKGRAGRIVVYIGVSALLAALNIALNTKSKKDKDNLTKLSVFTKNNYFVVPMNNGKPVTIPKPRELAIPISAFERLFETLATQNPHAFDDFWEYVTDNMLPGVVSGVAQGDLNSAIGDLGVFGSIHYLVSNQDFLGRPIVSSSLQNLEAKDQYAANTSKLAYYLGQAFNLSPQQIDFIGNEIFGGFWSWQKALSPVNAEPDYTLGVKGKWVKDPLYSTDIPNRMYNQRDKLEKIKNSNPDNVDAAINYRTVSDMASFYGKYYKLARSEKETPQSRETRSTVLDMILGVENKAGSTERAYKFMVDACRIDGSSALMPAVMDTFVKDDNGKTYNLTSQEYFTLQTRYNSLYYNYIRAAMDKGSMSDAEKVAVLKSAKKLAGIVAKGETLQAKGATSEDYEKIVALYGDENSDVDEGELTRFLANKSMADVDGSGSVSNAELLSAVSGLRLPSEDEVALTRYANPDLGLKLEVIAPYGVSAEEYSKVLEILGPGTPSQERAEAAIDEVYGRTTAKNKEEKAAVWQSLGKEWKTSNNPYDPNAGSKVQSGLVITAK